MRDLARLLLRLLGRDERGAVGIIVAVLISGGVLLGMAALVVDVGQIYQNRAELQNGADAAALAIATQCANGTCPADPVSFATGYAIKNASALTGGSAGVDCVRGSASSLSDPSCPLDVASGSGLTNCPKDPPSGTNFVDVQTNTALPGGSTLLPPVFAETLVGRSSYDGTTVKACAQAEWGPAGGLAVTISACEFDVATGGTGNPDPQPGARAWDQSGPPSDPSYDIQFLIHDPHTDSTCPDGPANQDAPGAFGWTAQTPSGSCLVAIVNGSYGAEPGNHAKGGCEDLLKQLWRDHTPVSVPVYQSVAKTGHNATYKLGGFASIVITGFSSSGVSEPDWLNGPLLCSSPDTCIDGYLTSASLSPSPGNGVAMASIKLTG